MLFQFRECVQMWLKAEADCIGHFTLLSVFYLMKQYKPKRYFLSSLNTYFGNTLVQQLRNDHEQPDNPHLIVGSPVQHNKYGVPDGVRKVIDSSKLTFLSKVLLDSDVIVFDLMTCNLNEAEFAVKTLKNGDLKEEKILIFVSSVMVWSDTPPKEKHEGDEEDAEPEGDPPSDVEKEPEQQDGEEGVVKKEYVRFTEADYPKRRALPQYEALKALETMCISAGSSKPNLKSFVLCAGVLYGMGEQVFYNHFKTAWLQDPPHLEYYGDGKNRVPCIHVKDLALFVQKVAERPPQLNYIFAIDHNVNPQQKRIITSISKGVGTGLVKSIPRTDSDENYEDVFTIDLRIRPTKAFDQFLEEAAQQEDNQEEGQEPVPKYTFNWWCKDGIQKNIDKINKEFNEITNLKPVRVFITGPPAVGKTYWGKQIAEYFNLPHIHIKDVVNQYKNLPTEEAEALRSALEELRTTQLEEAQAAYDLDKKKRKALGLPIEPFDESKIQPRLNEQQLYAAFKWRLSQNDCQNRGYVLDGYPKSYTDVRGVFLKPDKPADGDDQGDENVPMILDKTICPQSVINLQAADEFIIDRLRKLPEKEILMSRYSPIEIKRKFDAYKSINKKGTGFPIMINFFKDHQIEVLEIDANNSQNKIFEQCQSFIERDGRFNNYRDSEVQKEEIRLQKEREEKEILLQREQKLMEERDKQEQQLWNLQEAEYGIKQEHSSKYEREILDSRSQPLRTYLQDNVVPFITEGLVELIKHSPEDPIDFLAEYLFKRSLQVQFPDPGRYFEGLTEQQ